PGSSLLRDSLAAFFYEHTRSQATYPLSLHDALPILFGIAAASLIFLSAYCGMVSLAQTALFGIAGFILGNVVTKGGPGGTSKGLDRKSTRLNSSHSQISYAVFCLKKKIEAASTSNLR